MSRENRPYPLRAIYFNLTDRCNLRCRHCWIAPPKLEGMALDRNERQPFTGGLTLDRVKAVVEQALPLGLTGIKLTGGEPFLRTDILDFIAFFHHKQLTIDIETNGTLIDSETAKRLSAYPIRTISVSLDSATAEQHDAFRGVKGAFADTLKGLECLTASRFRPQIIMALGTENRDQIEKVAHLAVKRKAGSLKINPINPVGRGSVLHSEGKTLTVPELLDTSQWVNTHLQAEIEIPIFFSLPVAFVPIRKIVHDHNGWCAILSILGIAENGDISFCGIQCIEKDLVMGNVRTDDLAEIWENHTLLRQIRERVPSGLEGICEKCFFKRQCLGECRACVYHQEKNLTGPYWFCQEAFEAGLFPETRYLG